METIANYFRKRKYKKFEKIYPNVEIYGNILRDGYSFVAMLNEISYCGIHQEKFMRLTSYEMALKLHNILFSEYFMSLPKTAHYKLNRDIYPGLPEDHPRFNQIWSKTDWVFYGVEILYDSNHALEKDGFIPSFEESLRQYDILSTL